MINKCIAIYVFIDDLLKEIDYKEPKNRNMSDAEFITTEFERYKYAAFVTNMDLSAEMIWHLYNKRADCENRIRELRNDYGIDGFCMDDFYATEAAFRWTMVDHNLMSLFRLQVLNHKHHPVLLSTMKFQCIEIGPYLVKSGRRAVL